MKITKKIYKPKVRFTLNDINEYEEIKKHITKYREQKIEPLEIEECNIYKSKEYSKQKPNVDFNIFE